jgi:hypothetical protein
MRQLELSISNFVTIQTCLSPIRIVSTTFLPTLAPLPYYQKIVGFHLPYTHTGCNEGMANPKQFEIVRRDVDYVGKGKKE